jgi:hypothetical protein
MTEAWRSLTAGDRVRVVHPISETERTLLGRVFTIARIDATHGYAVCSDEHGSWHIHPEALIMEDPQNR